MRPQNDKHHISACMIALPRLCLGPSVPASFAWHSENGTKWQQQQFVQHSGQAHDVYLYTKFLPHLRTKPGLHTMLCTMSHEAFGIFQSCSQKKSNPNVVVMAAMDKTWRHNWPERLRITCKYSYVIVSPAVSFLLILLKHPNPKLRKSSCTSCLAGHQ